MPKPPLNPGKVLCLGPGCDKFFMSTDKATNRLCPSCTRKSGRDRQPRVYTVEPRGHDVILPHD